MQTLCLLERHKWRVDSNPVLVRMALSVLAAVACLGADAANPSPATSSTVHQISATPSKSADASPASGNAATCMDSPSDAQIDAGELRQLDLQDQGDELKATFKLAHSLPQTGTFGAFLGISNADGSTARQLGVAWLDGKLMSYYVFDVGKAQQQNLKGEPVVDNRTVIATFPWDAVSDLGAVWNWDAATAVEGEDADYCTNQGPTGAIPRWSSSHPTESIPIRVP
jgi:hypothetical protein